VKLFSDTGSFSAFRRFPDACVQSPSFLEPFLGQKEPLETLYSLKNALESDRKAIFWSIMTFQLQIKVLMAVLM
jgi:hypothetical protein